MGNKKYLGSRIASFSLTPPPPSKIWKLVYLKTEWRSKMGTLRLRFKRIEKGRLCEAMWWGSQQARAHRKKRDHWRSTGAFPNVKLCVYVVTVRHFHGDFHLLHPLLAPYSQAMASNQQSYFNVIEPGKKRAWSWECAGLIRETNSLGSEAISFL